MKTILFSLFAIASSLSFASRNPIGERASYVLNDSSERSSWVIKSGRADAKIVRYAEDAEYGPGYILEINYDMDVRLKGKQRGTISLLVPDEVFNDSFMNELSGEHPRSYGTFDVDYLGTTTARDANDRSYNRCGKVKIFNVSPNYTPRRMSHGIRVLGHESINFDEAGNRISAIAFEDLEIILKVHPSLPVLGAVQLDVSGVAFGISFTAGFDFKS